MKAKSFGQVIKELRIKHKNYNSLRDFAKKVGLSPAYISRIENDREPPPSEKVVERLAEALEADKYELFSYAGKVPPEFFEAFRKNPKGVASFMRRAQEIGLETDNEWKELEGNISKIRIKRERQK